jgi:maleylacetate reductase
MSQSLRFTFSANPVRVIFGAGAIRQIGVEVDRLAFTRVALLCSKRYGAEVEALLGPRRIATIGEAVMHVPVEVVADALARIRSVAADGLVAVGGGSTIGLAKAVALETGLPILAVPTTYGGSEMTSVWGLTEAGKKRTGRDDRVRPKSVIYDPELTRELPPSLAAASGLNAMAHAVEALYSPEVDPVTALMAEESLREIARGLPDLATGPAAGEAVCYGAWLAGVCLDRAQMGIHHKLCHVLGGTFKLPHAAVHGVVLPYAAAFNFVAAPVAMQRIARALSATAGEGAPAALFAIARRVGAPASLAELGMRGEDLDRAAVLAAENPYAYLRPADVGELRALLGAAFVGRPPSVG